MINEVLLLLLIALGCDAMMLYASQNGWLRAPAVCALFGAVFTGLIRLVLNLPDWLSLAALLTFSALLFFLGRQHTVQPNASTTYASEQPSIDEVFDFQEVTR